MTKKQALVLLGLLVCTAVLVWAYRKWLHPRLKHAIEDLRLRWNTSEPYAARMVVLAIRAQDLDDVFRCVLRWLKRQNVTDNESREAFVNALLEVGEARFGAGPEADWLKVEQAFKKLRRTAKYQEANKCEETLPELNPS